MMEQKKKVLFVATVVKTHINTFYLPFLKMFKEYGWEVHVAAKNDFVDEPCVIPNCDRHFDIDFARSPFSKSNIKAYKQLKQIIETNHYDIIHCTNRKNLMCFHLSFEASTKCSNHAC